MLLGVCCCIIPAVSKRLLHSPSLSSALTILHHLSFNFPWAIGVGVILQMSHLGSGTPKATYFLHLTSCDLSVIVSCCQKKSAWWGMALHFFLYGYTGTYLEGSWIVYSFSEMVVVGSPPVSNHLASHGFSTRFMIPGMLSCWARHYCGSQDV